MPRHQPVRRLCGGPDIVELRGAHALLRSRPTVQIVLTLDLERMPKAVPATLTDMPTTRCKCGEEIHYTAEHVGREARCRRCARKVKLPKPKPEPPPKSVAQLNAEAERKFSIRLQIYAIVFVFICVVGFVVFVAVFANRPTPMRETAPDAAPG
jgi:hypothetical protein